MAVYRRSNRTRYVLAVLVLAALTLVTVDARSNGSGVLSDIRTKVSDGFSPLQRATHSALQPIGNFLTGALDYGSLRSENQRLRNQVAALQQQSVESAAEQAAAEQVLAEQHLPFVGQHPDRHCGHHRQWFVQLRNLGHHRQGHQQRRGRWPAGGRR